MATEPSDEQKTIDTLTADKAAAEVQIKTLTQANADAQEQIKKLTAAGMEAQKQIQSLSLAKAASDKQLEEATKVVQELKTQLSEKQAGVIEVPKVKIGKDFYELVGGNFIFEAQEVSLERLKEDSALAVRLVKEKVGNLRLIEK